MVATYSARNAATEVRDLPIDDVHPSELNPRKAFDAEALAELAESIRQHGVLQPIVVRPATVALEDGLAVAGWLIVAGERRWRASKLAGMETVPAVVREGLTDADHLRLALIENLARRDLDPIEEAEGYRQLHRVVGLRQAEIAAAVNRSQPAIANALRLLELPEDVQECIRRRELSVAHGIALARWQAFPALVAHVAAKAAADGWTSKQVERWQPDGWNLPGELARRVDHWGDHEEFEVCRQCPFNAYRAVGSGGVCLNPEHYDELSRAMAARIQSKRAAQREQAAAGGELPTIASLGGVIHIGNWQLPRGCSEACPCRVSAVGHGGDIVQVCTDRERFDQLRREEDARRREAKEALRAERTPAVTAAVDGLEARLARALALVVATALTRAERVAGRAAVERHGGQGLTPAAYVKVDTYGHRLELAEMLALLPPARMLRLATEALLLSEIEMGCGDLGTGTVPLTDWFLAAAADETPGDAAWERAWAEYEAWKAEPQSDELEDGGVE